MMKIKLDYHREGLTIEVPEGNLAGVIERPAGAGAGGRLAGEIIAQALRSPLGAPALAELACGRASGGGGVCVAIPDVTRPMPSRAVLPPVLEALEQAGIAPESIFILIATGLHRACTAAELEEMVGPEILGRIRILNHDARDEGGHCFLGTASTGVPIHADRRYCEAGLKIALGLVEPHFMAGFSGGRKLICPGLCAEQTIRRFHGPELIEHPGSANCALENNPTHRTCTEAARMAGVDFTVNIVLDAQRRIVGAFAGDLEQAFAAAAGCAMAEASVPIAGPADILIATGGGYPLDATWYQSIKGLVAAMRGVKAGGMIVMAAGLREGIGSGEFARLIRETADLDSFMEKIMTPGFYRDEQWQLEKFVHAARHARILLYSDGLEREVQRGLFVEPVASVEAGLARALETHGPDASILVMPHGPYLLPST